MRWRVLSAGFVVVFGSALAGQQARPPAGPTNAQVPTFKVQAEYVEVDVQVTDQKGSFVRDLKKEDFEVFENGKPQTISAFSVVDLPLEQPDRPIFRSVAIEPDVQSNEHRFDGRVYVVVLDDVHTAFTRTISAKNAVRRFIEQHFHANDLMAIAFTGGRGDVAQSFTSNKRLLLAAVDTFTGRKLPSVLENLNTPQPCGPVVVLGKCDPPRDFDSDERLADGRRTMALLGKVANGLNGVRGRKTALILVSEGFYYPLGDIMQETRSGRGASSGGIGATNMSIYAIDPRGLATGHEDAIDFNQFTGDPAAETQAVQEGLRMLAEGTGGFAAIDASDVRSVFDRIVADNTRYYVIAYHPPSRPRDAGKFYRIEVRVSRPGVTVRSRNGYTSPGGEPLAPGVTAPAQTSRTLVEALNSPVQLSDIRMRMFAAPFRAPGQNASVLFGIEIAGRDLPLEPNGTVEIASLAVDATGKAHDSRTDRLALNLEPSTRTRVEQTGVRILHRMSLAPGPYQLRVALTNPATNLAGSIIYDLHVPDFDRLPFSMSGLLLMSATGSRIITAKADEQARAMLPAPPTVMRSFPQNDELGLFAEVYDDDRAPAHKVGIVTTVRSNDGAVIFEDAQERESSELRGQGMFRYTMRIPLASLDPGAYVLSVEARSRLNESLTAERHVPFAVTPPSETGR